MRRERWDKYLFPKLRCKRKRTPGFGSRFP
jgi:hypothetical protein